MEKDSYIDDQKVIEVYNAKALKFSDFNAVLDASDSSQSRRGNLLHDYFHKRLALRFLEPKKTDYLLDFGCGVGRLSTFLSPYVGRIEGIDRSSQMINIAGRTYSSNVRYSLVSSSSLPFSDATFNKILSFWVLASIGDEMLKQTFAEFCRVLKPGGRLFLFEQVRQSPAYEKNVHKQRRIEEYLEIGSSCGLKIIKCAPVIRQPSYAMGLWKTYNWLPRLFLPLLYKLELLTLLRKPEFVEYYTYVFVLEK